MGIIADFCAGVFRVNVSLDQINGTNRTNLSRLELRWRILLYPNGIAPSKFRHYISPVRQTVMGRV